jgi:raffinose/stachyose/melibiose transport system permease protein
MKRALQPQAYLFLFPALGLYAIFVLQPLAGSVYLSFFDWNGISPVKHFIGFANFAEALRDPIALLAFGNTLIWIGMSYAIQITLAFMVAVLISSAPLGRQFFRVALFLPKILSIAVVAVLWSRMYDPFIGIITNLVKQLPFINIGRGILGEPGLVLPAVNIANAWNGYPFYMVLYLAGLQSINPSYYEAAALDGAGWFQQLRHITLPGIRDVNTMVLSLSLINSLKSFDIVWAMTQGGPFYKSEVIATHIFKSAFSADRVSYGTAMSMLLSILIIGLTILFTRVRERTD